MKYIETDKNSSSATVNCELVVLHDKTPVILSLVDIPVRVNKVIADIVTGSYGGVTLQDREDETFRTDLYTFNGSFKFKKDKIGDLSHAIVHNSLISNYCIDWDNQGIEKSLSAFIRRRYFMPISEDIVSLLVASQKMSYYTKWYTELTVYSDNKNYDNIKGWFVDFEMLKTFLGKLKYTKFDSDFNWDEIEDMEDYILNFANGIKTKLQENVHVLYSPNKISKYIFNGVQPYSGQIPIIQSGIEVLKRSNFVYYGCEPGLGKASRNTARVYTPDGYKFMGDIIVGDKVLNPDGGIANVIGVYPQGIQKIYRVTMQDGSFTDVTSEHLWQVQNNNDIQRKNGQWRIMTTEQVKNSGLKRDRGYKWMIPSVNKIDFKENELEINPYLLGVILGDGGISNRCVNISTADEELIEIVEKILPETNSIRKINDKYDYRIIGKKRNNPTLNSLTKLGLMGLHSHEKFIPKEYLYSSYENRMELLRGLLDTDGNCSCGSTIEYSTSSPRLAEDIIELVNSVGGVTKVLDRIPKYIYNGESKLGKKSWRIYINMNSKSNPFKISRRIESFTKTGKYEPKKRIVSIEYVCDDYATCIKLDSENELYITDNFIVTHNTILSIKTADSYWRECNRLDYQVLVVAPAITITQWRDEIKRSIEDVDIHIIKNSFEFINVYKKHVVKPTFYLVGKETFKLDSKKIAGILEVKRVKTHTEKRETYWGRKYDEVVTSVIRFAQCPNCGSALQNENRKGDIFFQKEDFTGAPKKSNYKCSSCQTVLWQQTYDKTKKTSLINYIKVKNIHFDTIIADEVHESNNANSIIGNAVRTVFSHGKKNILLSGTSNNGYASSMHNILMGVKSRQIVEDGCLDVQDFIKRYGTLQAITKRIDGEYYKSGRSQLKESEFNEIEGINPVVFTKYLAENYIFADLKDLEKELPEINEYYIPIMPNDEQIDGENKLSQDIKEASAYNYRRFEDSIIRHYINNCFYWNPITIESSEDLKVITPKILDHNIVLPKEEKLLEIVEKEVLEGRKVWIYTDFSGESGSGQYMNGINIPERLKELLENEGYKVFWLKPNVAPIDRKDLIEKNKNDYDIFISNPALVQLGINLQWCGTWINYIPSYHVNRIDQAMRRGFRANSTIENRLYHLYYTNSCEHGICSRFQRKLAESKAIQGKFDVVIENENIRTASAFSKKVDNNINSPLTK